MHTEEKRNGLLIACLMLLKRKSGRFNVDPSAGEMALPTAKALARRSQGK